MFTTLITIDHLQLWGIKAQFSLKPNWTFKTMVVFSVYFPLTPSIADLLTFRPQSEFGKSVPEVSRLSDAQYTPNTAEKLYHI